MSKTLAELTKDYVDEKYPEEWDYYDPYSYEELRDSTFNHYFKGMEDMKELILDKLNSQIEIVQSDISACEGDNMGETNSLKTHRYAKLRLEKAIELVKEIK